MKTLDVKTSRRTEFVEVTAEARRVVRESGLREGAVVLAE